MVRAALVRALLLGAMWWALAEGREGYAAYGLLAVPLAVLVSLWLVPPGGPTHAPRRRARRAWGVVTLAGWYAVQVLAGGVDVTRRLLRRKVDVAPVVRCCRCRLPDGLARQLAVGMYGLMPGALVSDSHGDLVWLHSLDAATGPEQMWRDLEEHVARAAGVDLGG